MNFHNRRGGNDEPDDLFASSANLDGNANSGDDGNANSGDDSNHARYRHRDALLLGREDFRVRAFDRDSGKEIWNFTYAEFVSPNDNEQQRQQQFRSSFAGFTGPQMEAEEPVEIRQGAMLPAKKAYLSPGTRKVEDDYATKDVLSQKMTKNALSIYLRDKELSHEKVSSDHTGSGKSSFSTSTTSSSSSSYHASPIVMAITAEPSKESSSSTLEEWHYEDFSMHLPPTRLASRHRRDTYENGLNTVSRAGTAAHLQGFGGDRSNSHEGNTRQQYSVGFSKLGEGERERERVREREREREREEKGNGKEGFLSSMVRRFMLPSAKPMAEPQPQLDLVRVKVLRLPGGERQLYATTEVSISSADQFQRLVEMEEDALHLHNADVNDKALMLSPSSSPSATLQHDANHLGSDAITDHVEENSEHDLVDNSKAGVNEGYSERTNLPSVSNERNNINATDVSTPPATSYFPSQRNQSIAVGKDKPKHKHEHKDKHKDERLLMERNFNPLTLPHICVDDSYTNSVPNSALENTPEGTKHVPPITDNNETRGISFSDCAVIEGPHLVQPLLHQQTNAQRKLPVSMVAQHYDGNLAVMDHKEADVHSRENPWSTNQLPVSVSGLFLISILSATLVLIVAYTIRRLWTPTSKPGSLRSQRSLQLDAAKLQDTSHNFSSHGSTDSLQASALGAVSTTLAADAPSSSLSSAQAPRARTKKPETASQWETHDDDKSMQVGKLDVYLEKIKGHGCNGTVVVEGRLDGRPVAVKRMLRTSHSTSSAIKEIDLLIRSDGHQNVVRYFAKEESPDFVYLALELCDTTLDKALAALMTENRKSGAIKGNSMPPRIPRLTHGTCLFLLELTSALQHLHRLHIVHCDIKPQNILVVPRTDVVHHHEDDGDQYTQPQSQSPSKPSAASKQHANAKNAKNAKYVGLGDLWVPKLSDMGLGKKLDDLHSSFTPSAAFASQSRVSVKNQESENSGSSNSSADSNSYVNAGHGTIGWRAPEVLLARASMNHSDKKSNNNDNDNGTSSSSSSSSHLSSSSDAQEGFESESEKEIESERDGEGEDKDEGEGEGVGEGEEGSAKGLVHSNTEMVVRESAEHGSRRKSRRRGQRRFRQRDSAEGETRLSRKVDIFSLGCIFYYVIDEGNHPFGEWYERESRIINQQSDLTRIRNLPEALDLIERMISPTPDMRPRTGICLEHPLLWTDDKKLNFLCEVSDRIEDSTANTSTLEVSREQVAEQHDKMKDKRVAYKDRACEVLLESLEANSRDVIGKVGWVSRMEKVLQEDARQNRYRKYDTESARDLLRFIRNKRSHFRDLDDPIKNLLSPVPSGFLDHFLHPRRFPRLLYVCWKVGCECLAHEKEFRKFIGNEYSLLLEKSSRARIETLREPRHRGWYVTEMDWINEQMTPTTLESARLENPPSKESNLPRNYKSSLCKHWERTKGTSCPLTGECGFAHGPVELRPLTGHLFAAPKRLRPLSGPQGTANSCRTKNGGGGSAGGSVGCQKKKS